MRGLKLNNRRFDLECEVASFTDAWIETVFCDEESIVMGVASFTDAWIETVYNTTDKAIKVSSHLLQMRGLKHN